MRTMQEMEEKEKEEEAIEVVEEEVDGEEEEGVAEATTSRDRTMRLAVVEDEVEEEALVDGEEAAVEAT